MTGAVYKTQFWLDNQAGVLTEFTTWTNSNSLQEAVEMLETTGLNADDKVYASGIRETVIPLNGWYNDTTTTATDIVDVVHSAQGTSVTKTWQLKYGAAYWYGEGLPEGLTLTADGHALALWSFNLRVSGASTKTSVAQ